jgi:hypothetical protein
MSGMGGYGQKSEKMPKSLHLTYKLWRGGGSQPNEKMLFSFLFLFYEQAPPWCIFLSMPAEKKRRESCLFFVSSFFSCLKYCTICMVGQRLCIHSYTYIICFPGSITKNALFSGWIFHSAENNIWVILNFFQKFAEIFTSEGNLPPVLTKLAAYFATGTTGVVDTGGK